MAKRASIILRIDQARENLSDFASVKTHLETSVNNIHFYRQSQG